MHKLATSATLWIVLVAALAALTPAAHGAEARLLTAADVSQMGGTDFDGGAGDYLLRNDVVEAVILAVDATKDFGIPLAPQNLPSRGVLIDAGTVGDRNDQLTEIHQVLNLAGENVVLYLGAAEGLPDPVFINDGATASITVFGIGLLEGVSSPAAPTISVVTTYSVSDGHSWIDLSTTVTNNNDFPIPLFSIADADVIGRRNRLPFQPFPDRGTKPPPLDLSDPFPSIGVWPYLAMPGNNDLQDGPVSFVDSPDGIRAGAVCYAFVADSLAEPLVGAADPLVAVASNFFDLAAVGGGTPPTLGPGESLTHDRKLVVGSSNSVESCLDTALPLLYTPLFGFDARAAFMGEVVDTSGALIGDAHLVFEAINPGAPDFAPLVTPLDENQDGVIDGVIPAVAGAPLPMTHFVTRPDGHFEVYLQALADPTTTPTEYRAIVYAPDREPVEVGGFVVDASTIRPGGPPIFFGDIVLPGPGTLEVEVFRNFRQGQRLPTPAKLTIWGRNGTPDPDFGSPYVDRDRFSGLSRQAGDGLDPLRAGNTERLSETFAGLPALNVAADPRGRFELRLAPGDYTVYASRGLEYTVDSAEITVEEGGTTAIELDLRRSVTSASFVSLDAHIHSTRSFDSSVPLTDRVVSYLAAGVEVMISTDHDRMTDYAGIIERLRMGHEIRSIVGDELSGGIPVPPGPATGGIDAFPEGIGHWNAFPLSLIPGARRSGAPADEFINPGTAIDRLRGMDSLPLLGTTPDEATVGEWLAAIQAGQPGTPGEALPSDPEIVMLNHPRAGLSGLVVIGLLSGLANPGGDPLTGGYDPARAIDEFPNSLLALPSLYNQAVVGPPGTDTTGLSFDAIEILNGHDLSGYLRSRTDWFSLLDQGIHRAALAVSDSHRAVMEHAGYGRSYVACGRQMPLDFEVDDLIAGIRDMKVVGTTGPMIRFEVIGDGKAFDRFFDGIGDTVVATGEEVRARIRVEAAPWIPVEEIRVFSNGELFTTLPIRPDKVLGGRVLRFQRTVALDGIDADSYLVVEAGMRLDENGRPLAPELLEQVDKVEPGLVPLAFTNPVFVDRDGDGYEPPGL